MTQSHSVAVNDGHVSDDDVTFTALGIAPKLLQILEAKQFITPTPIQRLCIPHALQGKDMVGIAQTGTGKTLAFGIPLIQRLAQLQGQALILIPTRELALQVNEVMQQIGSPIGLRTAVIIGGASMHVQIKALRRCPHVVIATPGRLRDHMSQGTCNLSRVNLVILDEADRMLDIGFFPEIKRILSHAPKNRQTLLFSATMPAAIAQIAAQFMKMPLRIEVAPAGTAPERVAQEVYIISKPEKLFLLEKLLAEHAGTVLIFSRTKYGAKKIARVVTAVGHSAIELHSNRSLAQRTQAMAGFKSGKYRVLVATDIAARGIDVSGIALVINYDLPDNSEDYVHRIGRTGRAGATGRAISFATPDQRSDIKQIERLIKKTIPILSLPKLERPSDAAMIALYQGSGAGRGINRHHNRNYRGARSPNRFATRSARTGAYARRGR